MCYATPLLHSCGAAFSRSRWDHPTRLTHNRIERSLPFLLPLPLHSRFLEAITGESLSGGAHALPTWHSKLASTFQYVHCSVVVPNVPASAHALCTIYEHCNAMDWPVGTCKAQVRTAVHILWWQWLTHARMNPLTELYQYFSLTIDINTKKDPSLRCARRKYWKSCFKWPARKILFKPAVSPVLHCVK